MIDFNASEKLYHRACKVIPGGISSNNRASWRPFPLFYSHAKDSKVWDVDGNEYIDYVLGRGPLILGHSPRKVIDAMTKQLNTGLFFAGQTELEVKLAEKVSQIVPCAEMVRFCNTGSEAVHAALRLARSATGKSKVLRFEGHYHGWYDNISWSFSPSLEKAGPLNSPSIVPMSLGQNTEDGLNLFVLPWNRLDLVEALFKDHHEEIAAIITEPVMYNGYYGGILPLPGFLEGLRELCDRFSIILIFDEVITGFRLSLGGAQELFNVTPDLSTFAKALGGGTVISMLVGKKEIMRLFSDLKTVHTGTYNAYPPAVAGALAALEELSDNEGEALKKINFLGGKLMNGLKELARTTSLPLTIRGFPAAFTTSFNISSSPVIDYRTALEADNNLLIKFWDELHRRGIRTSPEGLWYTSTAHTEQDIDITLNIIEIALQSIEKTLITEEI